MHLQITHKPEESHSDMETTSPASRDIRQFHDLITCRLCRGYMIDPTTVDYCYHTYCRSCILKHLLRTVYCPDCKASGGKEITELNLKSDDTLRSLIYKLVPGLYQRECKQLADFEEQHEDLVDKETKHEQEFFTSTELVSLSLEYHPAMLHQCGPGEVPPKIYLQCAAGLRVELLKRLLCSKYNIDPENKLVEVEVTYEDEVLPSRLTLMDVGYSYNWSRQSPMAFCYRILLYESERAKNDENNLSRINQDIEPEHSMRRSKSAKSVTFAEDLESEMDSVSPRSKVRSKTSPKVSPSSKNKRVSTSKREPEPESPVSTFKSLRSNDMRYSDYAVSKVKSEPEQEMDLLPREREQQPLEANTNIVVSIPPSQLGKSYGDAEDFELKTANRKGVGHLPKLKIELNSMKSKLSMPMSAGPRLEDTCSAISLTSSAQQLDLETYAKNIGLKPIEQPLAQSVCHVTDSKYSPNASPMSSCSSSTNGSSSSLGTADASTSTSSSSSHRKRKKKHSKEPKDANGKRKKLHAEISSQTDGKMKMKITAKPNHKLDLKRSHSLASGELALQQLKLDSGSNSTSEALNRTLGEEARSISSLVVGGAPTPPPTPTTEPEQQQQQQQVVLPAKAKDITLPTSPPLPPSLFKAFTPSTTPTVPQTVAGKQPKQQQLQQLTPQQHHQAVVQQSLTKTNLAKPPLSSNNNRKPNNSGHFVVPQAPTNRNMYNMQRYLSTPSSIASAANKQPKRSMSLDETHPAKQARLNQAQAMASYTAKLHMQNINQAKTQAAAFLPNPQMRSYGPEMANKLPLLCPANLSLSLPNSAQVTITPRPRTTPTGYSFPEPNSHVPALEIVRLPANKQNIGGKNLTMPPLSPPATSSTNRLMGPPAALPKHCPTYSAAAKRTNSQSPPMPMPLPMPMTTIPTIVKSPPLSVALSGQRSNKSNSSNSSAYRTSPPALINLRNSNSAPHSFPSKSSPKVEANSKKSPPATGAAAAAVCQGKTNGTAALDKSKTSLREFRPAVQAASAAAAAVAGTGVNTTKDADILDLSANTGRSNNNNNNNTTAKLAPTSPPAGSINNNNNNNNNSTSNSLEAALNKIKQNISANSNGGPPPTTTTTAAAAASGNSNGNGNGNGDDLQNLHMLSESATAREKISIKTASSSTNNGNGSITSTASTTSTTSSKPKNANALVRPQNASVRSIPNPSALAFRNQPATITKPLTVRAEEKPKVTSSNPGLLSPTSSSSGSSSSTNSNSGCSAATSPRAMTKKPTTIDQVAANLNIRAEAKAAALAEEAPPVLSSNAAKSPELAKTTPTPTTTTTTNVSRTEPKETAITVSAASTLLPMPSGVSSVSGGVPESLAKPPVQIANAPVASSA
ncbi:protein suppressor 2 of zeste [Drosophila eugracilis]|uniref:protein suppressor 2 of zeste n=1 Tax=Drosophila eugracilis TaxID=29029 RepID=UPI0007E63F01|nr:protein suppressor 2 of zeste [Drosophila eugracilis]XP_017078871.1 protein suppressor 2 of zeste [Drosophila eugracilis]XP_017078872.1 protein suppressor 2 of zeste [Drosophila eugracilis]